MTYYLGSKETKVKFKGTYSTVSTVGAYHWHHSLISHHAASLLWASLRSGEQGCVKMSDKANRKSFSMLDSLGLCVPSQVSTAETRCTDQQHKFV